MEVRRLTEICNAVRCGTAPLQAWHPRPLGLCSPPPYRDDRTAETHQSRSNPVTTKPNHNAPPKSASEHILIHLRTTRADLLSERSKPPPQLLFYGQQMGGKHRLRCFGWWGGTAIDLGHVERGFADERVKVGRDDATRMAG